MTVTPRRSWPQLFRQPKVLGIVAGICLILGIIRLEGGWSSRSSAHALPEYIGAGICFTLALCLWGLTYHHWRRNAAARSLTQASAPKATRLWQVSLAVGAIIGGILAYIRLNTLGLSSGISTLLSVAVVFITLVLAWVVFRLTQTR
jgi:uncharacterized protein YacL